MVRNRRCGRCTTDLRLDLMTKIEENNGRKEAKLDFVMREQ